MKVTVKDIQEIQITDLVHSTVQELTKNRAIASQPLMYCNGYLFFIIEYPETKELILDTIKSGILYYDTVVYCESPYVDSSKFNGWNVDCLDVSNVKTLVGMFEQIKEGKIQ